MKTDPRKRKFINIMFQSCFTSSLRVYLMRNRVNCRCRMYSTGGDVPSEPRSTTGVSNRKVPPPKIHRVTYEYPPPPKRNPQPPRESSPWKRHIPLVAGLGGLLWAGYAIYYFFGEPSSKEQSVLNPISFTKFRITHKESISEDTMVIELAPTYSASAKMLSDGATLWNGKKLWSVQVKHPMIQIARNYTPLPLYYMQSDRPKDPALLRIMGKAEDEGKMCLLVKKYQDGEMSRYLHCLPVGSDVELRGPFVEHKFPYGKADSQPMRQAMLDVPTRMPAEPELDPNSSLVRAPNIAMFTAGTGITTALQMLLSPYNPPRGFTHVFHSARSRSDVPFNRFMLFLESAGRAKFHIFIDDERKFINAADIPDFTSPASASKFDGTLSPKFDSTVKYHSVVQQAADMKTFWPYAPGISFAVVCGPPGYISYVSGDPGFDGKNPISGLMGSKGWDLQHTARMLDI